MKDFMIILPPLSGRSLRSVRDLQELRLTLIGLFVIFTGRLCNIGRRAPVEIVLRGGSTFSIGSDEAGDLARIIFPPDLMAVVPIQ